VLRIAAADVLEAERLEGVLLGIMEAALAPSTAGAVPLPRCTGEDQE
jgi:hypothetical protein